MFIERLESRFVLSTPTASNPIVEYLTRQALDVTFDVDVSANLAPSDLQLTNITTSPETLLSTSNVALQYPGSPNATAVFLFINGLLANGNYRGALSREDVTNGGDEMASDVVWDNFAPQKFFVLAGDANRDRTVDVADLGIVASNGQLTGMNYSQGDFDYNGTVDVADLGILASNWQALLPEAPQQGNVLEVANLGGEEGARKLRLNWNPNGAPAGNLRWRIQRSEDGQNFTPYAHVAISEGQFVDDGDSDPAETGPGLPDGTRFWYRVRAVDGTNEGAYTPKRGGTTRLPAPTAPGIEVLSSTQMKITWTDASQNETEFLIYRSADVPGVGTHVGIVASGQSTQFVDTGLDPSRQYYYYVTAKNQWTESGASNFVHASTEAATAAVDLDVFEDVDGDFVHDNSDAAEQAEGNQPTELPLMEEDGDYERLALVVSGAAPSATVTFTYSQSEIQLYQDIIGLYPINSGQVVNLADLGISGSGSAPLFVKLTAAEQLPTGTVTSQLGGGSTGTNVDLAGGITRRAGGSGRPDDPTWHDGNPNNDVDLGGGRGGGLDDGDGPEGDLLRIRA